MSIATRKNDLVDGYSALATGPSVPLLTTAEAKEYLRVDFSGDDTLIDSLVAAATDTLDAQFGEMGRALLSQQWTYSLPCFPSDEIALPYTPVIQVVSVQYYDTDGTQQTLGSGTYRLVNMPHGVSLVRVDGEAWPSTFAREDAVIVTYDAGYGSEASDVPDGIRLAARVLVKHFYDNRPGHGDDAEVPFVVGHLLSRYRVARALF